MNIVVSGASSGIGYEIAKQAALIQDNLVVAIARSEDKLQALRTDVLNKNPDARIYTLTFDLATGNYKELSHEIFDFANKYDLLINNAGLLINKPLKELTASDFDQMYQVNSRAVFLLSKVLLPRMPKGSQIINISSMSGFQGSAKFPGLGLYSATKGATAVLTESMAREWASDGITVNCLCPGAVDTQMLREAFPGYETPVKAENMAEFILNFAETANGVMNGQIIPVTLSAHD